MGKGAERKTDPGKRKPPPVLEKDASEHELLNLYLSLSLRERRALFRQIAAAFGGNPEEHPRPPKTPTHFHLRFGY